MKKLLLILLLLTFAVPAGAEVFVYNWIEKSNEFEQYEDDWYSWKGIYKGYIVMEINDDKASAIFLETWTEKDDGKTYRLMNDWEESFSVVIVPDGKKTICVLSSGDEEYRSLLTGEFKKEIVTKFSGSVIWDEEISPEHRDIGSSQVSIQLNKKWTTEVSGLTLGQAEEWIISQLSLKGYEWEYQLQ